MADTDVASRRKGIASVALLERGLRLTSPISKYPDRLSSSSPPPTGATVDAPGRERWLDQSGLVWPGQDPSCVHNFLFWVDPNHKR